MSSQVSRMEITPEAILARCIELLPGWRGLAPGDLVWEAPKGFSSYTLSIRAQVPADPPGVFYRRLAGKENAILESEAEKEVFLTLGDQGIAAGCLYYGEEERLEELYDGRTLCAEELRDPEVLRGIAQQLRRFHRLRPPSLPARSYFDLLHDKWGRIAKRVLEERQQELPREERGACDGLRELYTESTRQKVQRCLPQGPLVFCHNDTYHGNIMRLAGGEIRLLDFEFSCLNHPAFDFANLFAETVMRHQQPDYPYFRIAEPSYSTDDIARLIDFYLQEGDPTDRSGQAAVHQRLLRDSEGMVMLADYTYALASVPLAIAPVQKIRFIPYAQQRFARFLRAYDERFA